MSQQIVTFENTNIFLQLFSDELMFCQISKFLTISEILKLYQINKQFKNIIEQKCKKIIQSHNLTLIQSKTPIHQMRFYFDRCLTIFKKKQIENISYEKLQISHEKLQISYEKLQKVQKKEKYYKNLIIQHQKSSQTNYLHLRTIQNPFKYKTITYFQVSVIFTVCLTIENEAFIFKTSKLINTTNLMNSSLKQTDYQKKSNILQIKVKSQHITLLKQNGEIYRCYGTKGTDSIIEKQQLVEWSNQIQIQQIESSFNYTIFKPKKAITYEEYCKWILGYDIDLNLNKQITSTLQQQDGSQSPNLHYQNSFKKTTLIVFNNIAFKYNFIQFDKKHNILQMAVGHRQAYVLNDCHQCFICHFQQNNDANQNTIKQNKVIIAKKFKYFEGKTIVKIASGYNFYLALERQIFNVEKWSVQEVCKWVRQIGFGSFVQIFMAEKVDGKKLLTIDKNYMYSNLGITKPNMQQKFLMLLHQVINNKQKIDTLYGWGKNENGQLGSRNANYIKQPQKIKINCIKQHEFIDSIFCGWYETFIRTQKGRIYRTVNNEKKRKNKEKQKEKEKEKDQPITKDREYMESKKMALDAQSDDNENGYEKKYFEKLKGNNPNRKKRKNTQDLVKKETGHKKFQDEEKWIECEVGKAFFVRAFKDIIFYIQCPSQKQFEPTKQKKLRTAKMLLNKIIWSFESSVQEEYKIGYMDKDMGLIEETINELRMFDYNENRIKYIKKSETIVWDRENKIDHFS